MGWRAGNRGPWALRLTRRRRWQHSSALRKWWQQQDMGVRLWPTPGRSNIPLQRKYFNSVSYLCSQHSFPFLVLKHEDKALLVRHILPQRRFPIGLRATGNLMCQLESVRAITWRDTKWGTTTCLCSHYSPQRAVWPLIKHLPFLELSFLICIFYWEFASNSLQMPIQG